ncbi:hypothetical protein OG754_40710 (plasmid) [Streptomyces decoyicus]|uniref:hypothetical protein n=1 Tax=Streptomyces decoyicus TaxID=249567 RepID=UPI002E33E11A|nr:hypothetical protein [Streptomyces decoyicus]
MAAAAAVGALTVAGAPAADAATTASGSHAGSVSTTDSGSGHFKVSCHKAHKKANFSWHEGSVFTKIYFNNHCSHQVKVRVHMTDASRPSSTCMKVNRKTKGSHNFHHGLTGHITKLTKGC